MTLHLQLATSWRRGTWLNPRASAPLGMLHPNLPAQKQQGGQVFIQARNGCNNFNQGGKVQLHK